MGHDNVTNLHTIHHHMTIIPLTAQVAMPHRPCDLTCRLVVCDNVEPCDDDYMDVPTSSVCPERRSAICSVEEPIAPFLCALCRCAVQYCSKAPGTCSKGRQTIHGGDHETVSMDIQTSVVFVFETFFQ